MLSAAMAQSSSDSVVIHYVLSVLHTDNVLFSYHGTNGQNHGISCFGRSSPGCSTIPVGCQRTTTTVFSWARHNVKLGVKSAIGIDDCLAYVCCWWMINKWLVCSTDCWAPPADGLCRKNGHAAMPSTRQQRRGLELSGHGDQLTLPRLLQQSCVREIPQQIYGSPVWCWWLRLGLQKCKCRWCWAVCVCWRHGSRRSAHHRVKCHR